MSKLFFQVHRFGDNVALSFADSQTVYLTVEQVGELAEALTAGALDVIARPFVRSTFSTVQREIATYTKNGWPAPRGFSLDRDESGRAIVADSTGGA